MQDGVMWWGCGKSDPDEGPEALVSPRFLQHRACAVRFTRLLGGDKRGTLARWYKVNIPIADALYDAHLAALKEEGLV